MTFVLGPNGAGKSGLMSHIARHTPQGRIKLITAYRQNWSRFDAPNTSPVNRRDIESMTTDYVRRAEARYMDPNSDARLSNILGGLVDADHTWNREFIAFARKNDSEPITTKQYESKHPSPLSKINDVLALGGLSPRIEIAEAERIVGRYSNGDTVGIHQLSDGERNALLLTIEIVVARRDSIILIDEPERHLHRSITQALLAALIKLRNDCSFVIATHEVELPTLFKSAQAWVLRGCTWESTGYADSFDVSVLEPCAPIPDDIRRTILGSRRRIVFVEGRDESLDRRLYQLLLQQTTIVPKGGSYDVMQAVRGIRNAQELHWVHAFGLIDRDNRSQSETEKLERQGIFALDACSVESLYFGWIARNGMAEQQAQSLGRAASDLLQEAKIAALAALDREGTRRHLCALRCERAARNAILAQLPKRAELAAGGTARAVQFDPAPMMTDEEELFDKLRTAADLDGLLARYQLRESGAYAEIAAKLRFKSIDDYQDAVIAKLEHDSVFSAGMAGLLRPLISAFR